MKRVLLVVPLAMAACAQPLPEPIIDASTYEPGKAGLLVRPAVMGISFQTCPDGTVVDFPANCPGGGGSNDGPSPTADSTPPVTAGRTPPSPTGPTPTTPSAATPPADNSQNPEEPQGQEPQDPKGPPQNKGGPRGNNGWGNGDQDAPGNSADNNDAENNSRGKSDPTGRGAYLLFLKGQTNKV